MAGEAGLPVGQQIMAGPLVEAREGFLTLGPGDHEYPAPLLWSGKKLRRRWCDTLVRAPGGVWS